MKCLWFCNLVPCKLAGFENLLIEVGRCLREQGDRLVIAWPGTPIPALASALESTGTEWRNMPGWTDDRGSAHPWRFTRRAISLVRTEQPDVAIVHFGNELPSLLAALSARRSMRHPPRWVWQQDQQIGDPGILAAHCSRIRTLGLAFHQFVAVYEGGRESMIRRRLPADRITVVRNGIPDVACTVQPGWLKQELGLDTDRLVAVTVGSLIPRKRLGFQLRAMAHEAMRECPLHLVIVGDGPERERLKQCAIELGISERVSFLGNRDDVRGILAEADLLWHSAIGEGSSYAIAEAICAGLPTVITRAGAADEQVLEGATGFVVGRDDLSGFAQHAATLAKDTATRIRFSEAARKHWEAHFDVKRTAHEYATLYRALAQRTD
ncbi:MAG: glycosyltransferase family 4 protein [Verrucomicrobia bacterium]|jgi:glycosyltransferase involved in cell wall biosynthesis|nr:glycosyltransferase family 4 protein [Verrucomicrobiota bacterium]